METPISPERWSHISKLLLRPGPLAGSDFQPCPELRELLMNQCRILCIGAGGLGCELLKDLALMGFRNIDVIDMDTIDVSNLNRQFLFRPKDVGRDKATVAAEFVNKRVPGCNVVPHFARIESFGTEFYSQFQLVVCGLDSIAARRWINGMLLSLVSYDDDGNADPSTIIPLIDGGTEGFKGNVRVIYPSKNACIECGIGLYPPQINYPMCTLATTPRLPEHCIEYVKLVVWPKERESEKLDGDDPEHIKWIFEKSQERAQEYGIAGVTYRLTQGVVKHIIPNVASTSAVIAAAIALEAFKLASTCAASMNNYMVFNDTEGVNTYTFEFERNEECHACSGKPFPFDCNRTSTLTHVIESLKEHPVLKMAAPGLTTMTAEGKNKTLYIQKGPLEAATRKNLDLTLEQLGIQNNQVINVTDPTSPKNTELVIRFKE